MVETIEKGNSNNWENLSLLLKSKGWRGKLEEVSICHIYKEENRCANILANVECNIILDIVYFGITSDNVLSMIETY